ncbi:hypothetical protein RA280_45600 [Cupriavidus sp. CV2]|uniref:hypothetical protein n=1 Tax=Cupriavidus ulmosensis TaxID=3065913 RepID=UPI00296AF04A|nr:hypothetical protein [Cupriavidus sp. CV2]MDW3688871.1 hypothetical protein [Cupriavidus sp. CV2]
MKTTQTITALAVAMLCHAAMAPSEEFIYHNLDDTASMGVGLSYFRSKLAALGVIVPETMFTQVLRDKALNIGNRNVVYQPDGSFEG